MTAQSALDRFFDHAELVSHTLRHLELAELIRLSPTLLPHVAAILYCRVDFERYLTTIRLTSRWKQSYLNAIRILDASGRDQAYDGDEGGGWETDLAAYEIFEPAAIARLLEHCPNITEVSRTRYIGAKWVVHPVGKDGGRLHRTIQRRIPSATITAAPTKLEPPESWPNWDLTYAVELLIEDSFFNRSGARDQVEVSVKMWLLDFDNLDASICSLISEARLDMSLAELGSLCASRAPLGKRPIEEVSLWYVQPFTLRELSNFGKAARELKELALLPSLGNKTTAQLTAVDLSEMVKVIREDFPGLERLSIGLSGCWNGADNIISDHDIPVFDLPWDGKLKEVGVVMQDWVFEEHPGDIPLFAIARNVACLGGPECRYYISFDESGRTTNAFPDMYQLDKIVKWFRSLPPHRLAKMRRAQLGSIGVVHPRIASLEALGFTAAGDPVPPEILKHVIQLHKTRQEMAQRQQRILDQAQHTSDMAFKRFITDLAIAENMLRMERLHIRQRTKQMLDAFDHMEREALDGGTLDAEFIQEFDADRSDWPRFDLSPLERSELERWDDLRTTESLKREIASLEAKRDKIRAEIAEAETKRLAVRAEHQGVAHQ